MLQKLAWKVITTLALVSTLAGNTWAMGQASLEVESLTSPGKPDGYPGDATPYEFTENLFRGRRPSSEDELRSWAKQFGITMIVSLDNYHEDADMAQREQAWASGAGLKFYHLPMHHMKGPRLDELEEALQVIEDHQDERIFIHCKHGKDRTGLVVAAYRIKHEGVSLKSALEELYDFGHAIFLSFWDRVLLQFQKHLQKA